MNFDPRLTLQQIHALESLADQAKTHGIEIGAFDFHIRFEEESRPGRGHDITVAYVDGDHALAARVDVYGNGDGLHVAEVHFLCQPHDDLLCEDCEAAEVAA